MSDAPSLFVVGQRCPVQTTEGLQISNTPPMVILIGISQPTLIELHAIREGTVRHRFGYNDQTAWMTLHFLINGDLAFVGEVFHSAGPLQDDYTDAKLADLRAQLPDGIGFGCILVVVDTDTQRIMALRLYAWSNELSLAFLAAAEKTRNATVQAINQATDLLLQHSTDDLAAQASVTFELSGIPH